MDLALSHHTNPSKLATPITATTSFHLALHSPPCKIRRTKKSEESGTNKRERGNINKRDEKRDPHVAVYEGNLDIVKILLQRDANAKNPNVKGWTQKQLKNKSTYDQRISCENEKK
ncbi:Ankyrin repeat-containing domain [Sesbania bispinosa]|nr:Ankyrin repeat-containing domain [Sesbania bispinosa]